MRSKLLIGAIAFGMLSSSPIVFAQIPPPPPADPANPPTPSTDPLPPEMPMPADEAQQIPSAPDAPVVIDRSLPPGPPATPPTAGADTAISGATTTDMMTPKPAVKAYPPCSKTLQDNCRNPGEGPKRR
ncbi:MAG: hypothetical protein ABI668_04650 [Sphingorhabdus sp.]